MLVGSGRCDLRPWWRTLSDEPFRVISPSDPQWVPDPTGQRLAMIKASRRGAIIAALLYAPVVWVAALVTPPEGLGAPDGAGILVVVMSIPALALLGAGLTPAALGPRASAASAGLALAVGVPLAAVVSAMIGVYLVVAFIKGTGPAGMAAGLVLRDGVTAAVLVSPLIAFAAFVWVAIVRRWVGRRSEVVRPVG